MVDIRRVTVLTRPISLGTRAPSRYGRGTWLCWAAVRFAGLVVMTGRVGYPQSTDLDVFRYWGWASAVQAGHLPWSSFPLEYPPGILPFLALPGGMFGYELAFITLAFAADGLVLAMLRRGSDRGLGQWLWILAPIALGTVFWLRLDIFVAAALVGFVSAARARRWRTAGLCLGYACLLKLWPLVILIVVWRLVPASGRRRLAGWCLGMIAALTLPVVAWGGTGGLLAMLRYQGARGLEVESVAAYPLMLAWNLGRHVPPVFGHESMEFPVAGLPATLVSLVLPVALVILTALVWRGRSARIALSSATLTVAVVVLLASKMMSPQYLVWVLALTAVAIDEAAGGTQRERRRMALVALTATGLTQSIYPWLWTQVSLFGGTEVMVLLTFRLAALTVWAVLVLRYTFAGHHDRSAVEAQQLADPVDFPRGRLARDEIHA